MRTLRSFIDAFESRFECGDGARQYCTYDNHY